MAPWSEWRQRQKMCEKITYQLVVYELVLDCRTFNWKRDVELVRSLFQLSEWYALFQCDKRMFRKYCMVWPFLIDISKVQRRIWFWLPIIHRYKVTATVVIIHKVSWLVASIFIKIVSFLYQWRVICLSLAIGKSSHFITKKIRLAVINCSCQWNKRQCNTKIFLYEREMLKDCRSLSSIRS